jgi:miniconductance mechanosensitive channel
MNNLYNFAANKSWMLMHFINDPAIWLREILIDAGLNSNLASIISTAGIVMTVIFISWLFNLTAKKIILSIVTRIVKRTTSTWDDVFLEQKVFTRLSHFAPALVIWFMAEWALKDYPEWLVAVQKMTYIYMVLIGMTVVNSFIESWHKIYLTLPISQHRHIKGYVQVVKLVVVILALLIIISVVFKIAVLAIITGLGAMAAVLMLIFKDAILGLVASIQLSANNMLKVGDWITIPSRGVDGVTEDITLTTVKIRNFDKTIITIPAYALVNESFQNWRGMVESDVRQFKRSVYIDARSIKMPNQELLEKIKKFPAVKDYLEKDEDIDNGSEKTRTNNQHQKIPEPGLTNLGFFRIYAESYLRNNPLIDVNESLIVRHRDPDGNGLPLQIFAFSRDRSLVAYENLQSEIIEHFLAVLNEFDLRVYQHPTGDDIIKLTGTN